MLRLFYIGLFGLLGVYCRYLTGIAFGKWVSHTPLPLITLGINVLGAFLAGVAYVHVLERPNIPIELGTGLMIGFLGGFTTFSAYGLEMARLLEEGMVVQGMLYFSLSSVLGIAAAFGGLLVGRQW